MKIAYCLFGTYSTGGIERVTSVKANYLASHGHEVYLVTTGYAGRPPKYPLDERVVHIDLGINYDEPGVLSRWEAYRRNKPRYRAHEAKLNELFARIQPDIAVAAGWHEAKFLYRLKDRSRKVVEHHSTLHGNVALYPVYLKQLGNPSLLTRFSYWLRTLWGNLMTQKQCYYDKQFDQLVVLTEEDKEACTHCPTVVAIPNPQTVLAEQASSLDSPVILAVGRLDNQKNFPELVDIWARIARDYPQWKLRIVGEGYTDERILERVRAYGLEHQFELMPFTSEVQKYYLDASIYAMTSAFEGLPLVLVEAASFGLPLVSYACPCGPRDVIHDGVDGYLVPTYDQEAFAARLRVLIEDETLRRQMGEAARENAQRFSLDRVMARWLALFSSLIAERSHSTR